MQVGHLPSSLPVFSTILLCVQIYATSRCWDTVLEGSFSPVTLPLAFARLGCDSETLCERSEVRAAERRWMNTGPSQAHLGLGPSSSWQSRSLGHPIFPLMGFPARNSRLSSRTLSTCLPAGSFLSWLCCFLWLFWARADAQ